MRVKTDVFRFYKEEIFSYLLTRFDKHSAMLFKLLDSIWGGDPYTREFYEKQGCPQPNQIDMPKDNYELKSSTKFVPVKDQMMKDYLESQLGGGRMASQKQFLENDRKVNFRCFYA